MVKKMKFLGYILLCCAMASCSNGTNSKSSPKNTTLTTDSTSVIDTLKTDSLKTDSLQAINPDSTEAKKDTAGQASTVINSKLITPPIKVKGIYITGPTAGTKRMNELISLVENTEMNTIVLDIKNDGGEVTYKMKNNQAIEMDACRRYIKDIDTLIKKLHDKKIYVIGRIVCFKDPILAKHKPELALCKADGTPVRDGKGHPWVNPYKKGVWDYICDLAEQATKDGFDEIQFDYVRFPIGDDANKANYGVDIKSYTREQGLNDFFDYVEERLHRQNIIFGADLFGTIIGSSIDRDKTGQDYEDIARRTDAICPMIYPSHYANHTFGLAVPDANPYGCIYKALQLSKETLPSPDSVKIAVVRPWLQCFTAKWVRGHISYGSREIRQQIKAVKDAGYDEWILWNATNHYEQVRGALSNSNEAQDTTAVN